MDGIEQTLWQQIVANKLAASPSAGLTKKQQQALANSLQEWTAKCIYEHLTGISPVALPTKWEIHSKGRDFLGAIRPQEVDVWMYDNEAGLVLAVDPKHFQSQGSFSRNVKNGHNDLVAFATNLHERFPLCAVGGVIAFPVWAARPNGLRQLHGICSRSIPRERPLNAYGKFEGFALAIYNEDGQLVWPFGEENSLLQPRFAFESPAKAVHIRTLALR